MKINLLLLMLFLFLIPINGFCQKPDDIIGFWLTLDEKTNEPKSQVQIFKAPDGKYYGKVVWLSKPLKNNLPLKDENNPQKELKNRPILGLQILKYFQFAHETWEDGTIYDPKSGNTYKCKLWFENKNSNLLYVRGFIGFSFVGRSTQWKREVNKR